MKHYKHLHHYSALNTVQFVTFRTQDSVDGFLQKLIQSDLAIAKKQWQIDQYLDSSAQGAYFNGEIITLLDNYLKQLEPEYYQLIAFSIMPNHVHILFSQKQALKNVMHKVKGGSAILINKALGKQGKFWAAGYYDKAIKDEQHFGMTYDYIKYNGDKAQLADANQRFYGLYE